MSPIIPKTAFAIMALLCTAAAGCSTNTPPETALPGKVTNQVARNMAADYKLLQVFETGDVSKLDSLITPDFVNHAGPIDQRGLAAQKVMVQAFHKQVPNVKMAVKKRWADDDYVSDWVIYTGTMPTTVIEGIELTRYVNGKAVEHWFFPSSRPRKG